MYACIHSASRPVKRPCNRGARFSRRKANPRDLVFRCGRMDGCLTSLCLTSLEKRSWSTFNQCVSALKFLYGTTLGQPELLVRIPYGRRPKRLPIVLTQGEVLELLQCVRLPHHRMVLTTMYATGMRVDEAVHLGVADINSRAMNILVARGKGNKQRLVPLSAKLLTQLRAWWATHCDPTWLFPGKLPNRPLSEASVQKACQTAGKKMQELQEGHLHAHASPHVCHRTPRSGGGPVDDPENPGACLAEHDAAVHPRAAGPPAAGGPDPGSAAAGRDPEGKGATEAADDPAAAPQLEIADIIRQYGPSFLERYGADLPLSQRKVLAALEACRTARMGGHIYRCLQCGGETPLYNSCGDRHCPKCQGRKRAAWLEARQAELLPVEYFHVVFTVPHQLAPAAQAHPADFYPLLFRAVRETLLEVGAAKEHLGAQLGGVMVLHTWGQTLELHPHVHAIVPGGGLATRRPELESLSRRLLPAGGSAQPSLPRQAVGLFQTGEPSRRVTLDGRPGASGSAGGVPAISVRSVWPGLGGVCQAGGQRPRSGLEILGAVHVPRGDREQSAGVARGRAGDVPLPGLYPRRPLAVDDVGGPRVSAAVPAARVAQRADADPQLRIPGQSAPGRAVWPAAGNCWPRLRRGRDNVRVRPPGRSSGPGNRTGNRISNGTATLSSLRPR